MERSLEAGILRAVILDKMQPKGNSLQITHPKLAQPASGSRGKRLVTICAELAKPNEFVTITVAVLNSGTERDICERGVARAKDFARQFADTPVQHFPLPDQTRRVG